VAIIVLGMGAIAYATTIGTNISSDGEGGLIIQKGYAEFNYFVGVLGNKEAEESSIKIYKGGEKE